MCNENKQESLLASIKLYYYPFKHRCAEDKVMKLYSCQYAVSIQPLIYNKILEIGSLSLHDHKQQEVLSKREKQDKSRFKRKESFIRRIL
jgi:hypothetical protein